MIFYHCHKLYGGRVSVRDYLVKYARKTRQVIEIYYEGNKMRVNGNTQYECDGRNHLAKRTDKYIKRGETYQLYDYVWNPVVTEPEDMSLDGRMSLLKAWKNMKKGVIKK